MPASRAVVGLGIVVGSTSEIGKMDGGSKQRRGVLLSLMDYIEEGNRTFMIAYCYCGLGSQNKDNGMPICVFHEKYQEQSTLLGRVFTLHTKTPRSTKTLFQLSET